MYIIPIDCNAIAMFDPNSYNGSLIKDVDKNATTKKSKNTK